MIFSEIYGNYFNTVAEIISQACNAQLDKNEIYSIIERRGFGESTLNIPVALTNDWMLLNNYNETPILSPPELPLTTLQKRWMKSIILDKRIQLFGVDETGLEDVKPLFFPDTFVYYDRYTDGDDFESKFYIKNFKTILEALRKHKALCIFYETRSGEIKRFYRTPYKLEYSSKDDKFRLLCINKSSHKINTFNLNNINYCLISDEKNESVVPEDDTKLAEIIITDERNALERVLRAFSHLQKESSQIDDKHYSLKLYYSQHDETELLIRLLSFGPRVQLISPEGLLIDLKNRIQNQKLAN